MKKLLICFLACCWYGLALAQPANRPFEKEVAAFGRQDSLHPPPAKPILLIGDVLIAEARRLSETRKTGLYLVEVTNQHQQLIALFKGTCYKTGKPHLTHPPTE